MTFWRRYWFAPAPYVDLAVVRIVAVATQLILMYWFQDMLGGLRYQAGLPDDMYGSIPIFSILNLPFGWGYRPPVEVLDIIYHVAIVAGIFSLFGFLTNLSLVVFATLCVYLQAYLYSFGDLHHPQAVMMVMLAALALSPSGRVLSVDRVLRGRLGGRPGGGEPEAGDILDQKSPFAGWPLRLIRWFFVLMYLSAVVHKLSTSGLDWANGFTLQYYLIRDGLRWESPLAVWVGQHHELVLLLQYVTLAFQATFALAVIFPKLRWIYVPVGLGFHIGIYLTLTAPFFEWIALYAVFIPWAAAFRLAREWLSSRAGKRASAGAG